MDRIADPRQDRIADVSRDTKETRIRVRLNLDGSGEGKFATGIGFFDHMLDQVARHGLIDLDIECQGDLHIDGHHTVEDEALSRVVVDFSGRPGLHQSIDFKAGMVGEFDTQLTYEFFQGFVNHALCTLHIDNLKGDNAHHQAETVFKAFGRALRMALTPDPRSAGVIPSTKGSL